MTILVSSLAGNLFSCARFVECLASAVPGPFPFLPLSVAVVTYGVSASPSLHSLANRYRSDNGVGAVRWPSKYFHRMKFYITQKWIRNFSGYFLFISSRFS